jgi:hypothetical protein
MVGANVIECWRPYNSFFHSQLVTKIMIVNES